MGTCPDRFDNMTKLCCIFSARCKMANIFCTNRARLAYENFQRCTKQSNFDVLNLVRHDVLHSKLAAIEVSVRFSVRYRVEQQDQQRILHLVHFTVRGTSMVSVVCQYHNRTVEFNKLGMSTSSLECRDGFGHHLVATSPRVRARFASTHRNGNDIGGRWTLGLSFE